MKAVKVEETLNNKALVVVKREGHGSLRQVVSLMLGAYVKDPSAFMYVINAIHAGMSLQDLMSGSAPKRKETQPTSGLPGQFSQMFKNASQD